MSGIMEETRPARFGRLGRWFRYGAAALLALSVVGIGGKVLSQSAEIASLQAALGQVPGRDAVQQELDKLNEQVVSLSGLLKTLSVSQREAAGVSGADSSAVEHLAEQVRALDAKVSHAVSSDAVTILQARLEALELRIKNANSPQTRTVPSATQAEGKPSAAKKTTVRHSSVRKVTAPFRLTSIERRGGAVFVAVAPLQAFNLSDVQLVETGETVKGWTLLSVAGNQARFSVAGRTQTLSIQ
ncbi:hypothetical protein [Klebsiella oxytoca]|uniref:hypothetical protein n=1 Tax=Klebsiella oxytoca TaxID=571 RepID=UPI0039C988BA